MDCCRPGDSILRGVPFSTLDLWVSECLVPLALWGLVSGLDDLCVDLRFLVWKLRSRLEPASLEAQPAVDYPPEKRIAIYIPCWDEASVIGRMIERNLAAIEYENYDIWLGLYPNDPATLEAVKLCEERSARVHHFTCENPGPTTKADCLNQLDRGVRENEASTGDYYEVIVQHDAEDLIDARSLREISRLSEKYDMIQVPVLPLKTAPSELTHGAYCDEFAEFHLKERPLRVAAGGFLPSAGVGTAYRRDAFQRLRRMNHGQLFNPISLTEDYFIGLQIHWLGGRQHLTSADADEGIATRAYFPRTLRTAIRQRTRWQLGNCLQAWQAFGWRAGKSQVYWLWRDRKGLIGYPSSALANLLFLYGLCSWAVSQSAGQAWELGASIGSDRVLQGLLLANLVLFLWRAVVRMFATFRVYGLASAAIVPLRIPWSNLINSASTIRAIFLYAEARLRGHPLGWAKTEHAYPDRGSDQTTRRLLGEVLVSMRLVEGRLVEDALQRQTAGQRLGAILLSDGVLAERDLFRALAAQSGLVFGELKPIDVDRSVEHILDRPVWREERLIPFRLEGVGGLWLAGPSVPPESLRQRLRADGFRALRFLLISESNYAELADATLEAISNVQTFPRALRQFG